MRCRQLVWVGKEQAAQKEVECGRCRSHPDDVPSTCGICLDALFDPVRYSRVSNESWANERCGHLFCRGCLRGYLRAKLDEGSWNIRCPAVKCPYLWLEADVKKVAAPRAIVEEAERVADKSEGDQLVHRFRSLRYADYGVHLRSILEQQAVEENHLQDAKHELGLGGATDVDGLGGGTSKSDLLQVVTSEDFGSWARQLCQACPNCLVVVRKEIGCNHMACRCGQSFCYGCGAPSGQCLCNHHSGEGPQLARWLRGQGKIP